MTDHYTVVGHCALLTQDSVAGPMKILMLRGAPVGPGAKPDEIAHNLAMGLIEKVGGSPAPAVEQDVDEDDDDPRVPETAGDGTETPAGERPAGNASKDVWAAYAVSLGYDADEMAAASRDDIKALFK